MVDPIAQRWLDAGCPVDDTGIPHEAKAHVLRSLAVKHGLTTLVETGTGFGAMLAFVKDDFTEIHSVEMQPDFHASSKDRFKNVPHIHLYLGDSGEFVNQMVPALGNRPALWFLDAHYAGEGTARGDLDTPVMAELEAILNDKAKHVVVIDDARLFGKDKDYPPLDVIKKFALDHAYSYQQWGDEIVLA